MRDYSYHKIRQSLAPFEVTTPHHGAQTITCQVFRNLSFLQFEIEADVPIRDVNVKRTLDSFLSLPPWFKSLGLNLGCLNLVVAFLSVVLKGSCNELFDY